MKFKSFNLSFLFVFILLLIIPGFAGAEVFYIHEWGHDDTTGNDYTSIVKATFDNLGGFTGETITHSEGCGGTVSGSYTSSNGVITVTTSSGPDLEFRISPDGEKLAGATAQSSTPGIYNEVLRIGIKESSLNSINGTYYIFGWGHEDIDNFTVVYLTKIIFDGSGGYTTESIYDSEGDDESATGTYTISNGIITLSDGDEVFLIRISPDGETLAGITAESNNENIIAGVKEAPLSNINGTYYGSGWGHEDDITNYTCTYNVKMIFDGFGGYTSECIHDSQGDDLEPRTGTYTISNGFINFLLSFYDPGDIPDEGKMRISPDGETLVGITTQTDNENLMFAVKESFLSDFDRAMPWIPLLLLDD